MESHMPNFLQTVIGLRVPHSGNICGSDPEVSVFKVYKHSAASPDKIANEVIDLKCISCIL